jgi:L-lactate dehydrogenase complex protein LldG
MSEARELILRRVRAAIAGAPGVRGEPAGTGASAAAAPGAPAARVARDYDRHGSLDRAARIELLCERISDYRAEVRRIDAASLADEIAGVLAEQGAARVVVAAGVPAAWRCEGVEWVADDGTLALDELDRVDGVLSGCTLAIAQTGTLVLSAAPAEGRRALTLVPDLHVCVVETEQVVETVPEAIAALAAAGAQRRPITLISGPSATSDIELNRVEGVHGPRRLVVLVVHKEENT